MIKCIVNFVIANVLSFYYAVKMLLVMGIYMITHPFSITLKPKLRLMPPEILKHPKFGTHKYVKANNVKIHYAESGDSSKPLVVFMHGYPEFWYSWRHQIVHFNKHFWCMAIDMRGYGDSEKPEKQSDYKINNMVEDLRDFVRQMGREKLVLITHDWGGAVGWAYRDAYPETLSAFVSLASSSAYILFSMIQEDKEQFAKSWYIFMNRSPLVPEMIMSFNDMAIFEKMRKEENPNVTDDDIECYKYTFGKPGAFTPPLNYYRENFKYSSPKLKVNEGKEPCLFIQAGEDPYLVKRHAEAIKAQYPNCETVVLEGCGHFCQQENPEKVNAVIEEFLVKLKLLVR